MGTLTFTVNPTRFATHALSKYYLRGINMGLFITDTVSISVKEQNPIQRKQDLFHYHERQAKLWNPNIFQRRRKKI